MTITLKNNKFEAQIETKGAYVNSLDYDGKHVFFPFREMEVDGAHKLRGGNHVCAPNFGPDEKYHGLKQHGFGRDLEWEVSEQREDYIKLSLAGVDEYENVDFTIEYELADNKVTTSLTVENNSDESVLLAPAFHPYFYTKDNQIEVEGVEVSREELPKPIFHDATSEKIKTSEFDIEIIGLEAVSKYVIWTDFGDDYVCVEPTYNGMSFKDSDKEPLSLDAGSSFSQKFDIIIK